MITLKQVNRNPVDLSASPKFVAHYNKANSYSKYIIEREINAGQWHDELLDKLPEDAVIIDAGANVGLFSIYLNTGKRKFYCIEPTPVHVEIAKEVFEKLNCNAEIFEGVIFNKDGEVNLFQEASNSTMNRVGKKGVGVPSLTLKSFFEKYKLEKVDLLKLDVESAEQQIILEDETVGEALQKCKVVFIEVHPQDGFGNHVDVEGIINKMKSLGFTHKEGKREMSHYFIW